jgi:signal transduction histidine kinase
VATRRWRMPLLALLTLPPLLGVLLISGISWRLFDPAVTQSSEVALEVLEDMIRTTGSESLRYPLAVGDEAAVERLVGAMARNDLVFAVQVADAVGRLVARAQNQQLPIAQGIQLIEYRQPLYIQSLADEPVSVGSGDGEVYVGEVLFQLTPHVLEEQKSRLVKDYQRLIGVVLLLGSLLVLIAARILWRSARTITGALRRIAAGERGILIDDEPLVSEFDVIARGVNRLSENVDEARARQEASLQQLEAAVNSAQQSDRETRAFYETATREIADPVMQVVELLKLNQQGANSPVDPAVILHNAERVKLSVLAMLGKLEEAQEGRVTTEVDLTDYFRGLAARYRPRFARKGLAFHVNGSAPATMENVQIDSGTLDIVLEKLLENALFFTPQGEVRIHWQVLDNSTSGPELVISVKDNGQGIAAQNLEKVFDRYTQFAADNDGASGSGLGLYIARELLARKGGSLGLVSQRGVGSEFTVRLPVAPVTRAETAQPGFKGRISLTVGVDASQHRLIESSLAAQGMDTLQADTAIEALALLAKHPVHLLWVEEGIEDIDLDSFLAEARKRQERAKVVVLALDSADSQDGVLQVRKPVDKPEINAILRHLIETADDRVDYRLVERLKTVQKPDNE